MKKLILIMALMSVETKVFAQDVSKVNLSWNASKMIDAANNVSLENSSVFKTGPSKVEWIQGKIVDAFSVDSKEGSWVNVAGTGRITLHISDGSESGTVVIQRDENGIRLTLDISQGTSPRLVRAFTISSVTEIN